MAVNNGGWPLNQHGIDLRGTKQPTGSTRSSIIYPRTKGTYLVELYIDPDVFKTNRVQTNLKEYWNDGKLLTSLRSIDHPQPSFAFEKLRSYNKFVNVPTRVDYAPFNISFHDDNTSMVMALVKEYMAFYTYSGTMGRLSIDSNNPENVELNSFRTGNALIGDSVRTEMNVRPSMGMVVRPTDSRNFFRAIRIYDLGAEPDSVNIYTYLNPIITSVTHDELNYESAELVGVSLSMEYESYYTLIGVSNNEVSDTIVSRLGGVSKPKPRVPNHIRMDGATVLPVKTTQPLISVPDSNYPSVSTTGAPAATSLFSTGALNGYATVLRRDLENQKTVAGRKLSDIFSFASLETTVLRDISSIAKGITPFTNKFAAAQQIANQARTTLANFYSTDGTTKLSAKIDTTHAIQQLERHIYNQLSGNNLVSPIIDSVHPPTVFDRTPIKLTPYQRTVEIVMRNMLYNTLNIR